MLPPWGTRYLLPSDVLQDGGVRHPLSMGPRPPGRCVPGTLNPMAVVPKLHRLKEFKGD